MFKVLLYFGCFLLLNVTAFAQTNLHILDIKTRRDLKDFFTYSDDKIPLLCAHRGGATIGFPENSIATFENTLSKMHAFFEIDPRLTKDGVVVVFHDETLDRTTTGTGKIADYTWRELKDIKLKDPKGNVTPYGIHQMVDVLKWAKGKTILILDRKDVPFSKIVKLITDNNAESYVMLSAFKVKEARYIYKNNPQIMMEAIIKDEQTIKAYEEAGIPWSNIVAFTGQPLVPSVNAQLRKRGVMCMVSTVKFQDRYKTKALRAKGYTEVITNYGIDILMTNRAEEMSTIMKNLLPQSSAKSRFFKTINYSANQ